MVIVVFCQVLWEMLTQEVPFKGLLGVQVAWLVVVDEEVRDLSALLFTHHNGWCCLTAELRQVQLETMLLKSQLVHLLVVHF